MEVQVWSCDVELGDYGNFLPAKRGRMKLQLADRATLADLLRDCSPYQSFRLGKVTGTEKLAPDGASFTSKLRLRMNIRTSGQNVGVTVTVRVNGVLQNGGAQPLLGTTDRVSPRRRSLPGELVTQVVDTLLDQ
jgi:hypothetical protein